jgi:hypothetical protein
VWNRTDPDVDILVASGVPLAPEQESVLGRLLLARVALLLVHVDLDLLDLKKWTSEMPPGVDVMITIFCDFRQYDQIFA